MCRHGDRRGRYLLTCRDEESDYFFSTTNQDDINASLKLGDFCVIPIGQWRQSLYDYAKEVSERSHRHFVGEGPVDNYDDYVAFWHEGERLDALTDLAYAVASDNFADDAIQEKIQEYRDILRRPPGRISETARGSGRRMNPIWVSGTVVAMQFGGVFFMSGCRRHAH